MSDNFNPYLKRPSFYADENIAWSEQVPLRNSVKPLTQNIRDNTRLPKLLSLLSYFDIESEGELLNPNGEVEIPTEQEVSESFEDSFGDI